MEMGWRNGNLFVQWEYGGGHIGSGRGQRDSGKIGGLREGGYF